MAGRKSLSTIVAESLAEKVRSGELAPGSQLPTEAELCIAYEVSRTVVREAVARLRSEGLVVPQQGKGVFVSEAPNKTNFSISSETLKSLSETLSLLELRLGVEVEAAGLCAARRSDAEAAEIRLIMEGVDSRWDDPSTVKIHYDYDFHLAIAGASRNQLIHAFLDYLKPLIYPRFQLGHLVAAENKESYYARIHSEHDAIVTAIEARDVEGARHAMRTHLENSLERVRALAQASGIEPNQRVGEMQTSTLFAGLKIAGATG